MKRLFVSAALLPLLFAATAKAETKITTATTTPVSTSTAANGQPDAVTIDTGGSIAPTTSGAAITADSSNAVTINGTISFNNVSGATGVLITGGPATQVVNAGGISLMEDYTATDSDGDGDLDGPFALGNARYGIRAVGSPFSGPITTTGTISIEGNDSAGISVETRMNGTLTASGGMTIVGDRSVGVRADSVSGDVKVLGTITVTGEGSSAVRVGDVDGQLQLQSAITATGYRSTTRVADDTARAKLDADDLKQGGAAVRITGNIGRGILLDRPPPDSDPNNTDEDGDGIADSAEGTAAVNAYGGQPALDIGSATVATTIGAVGTGDLAYGIVNKGSMTGDGINDNVIGTALRIGQAGGGTVTVAGGVYNQSGASIVGRSYGAQATAILLNSNAVVPVLRNAGTIGAEQNGGLSDARGVVDLSGTLALVQNSGTIKATVTPKTGVTQTGQAIAIDLSANTTGAIVRQARVNTTDTAVIGGDVRFGAGNDRFELLAGTFTGDVSFGAGADTMIVDGGATASGRLIDPDGSLALFVGDGKLTVTNTGAVTLASLGLGSKAILAVNIDPTAATTRFNVTGAAVIDTGAQIAVNLTALSRGNQSYQILQAGTLSVGQAGATVAGAPFLYQAALRTDAATRSLYVDLRPKTAAELGLNRSGAEAFSAVFDALDKNAAIQSAFLGQTSQSGFQGLYNQMLPDHSGGVLMAAQAISRGVSSAVSQPQRIDADSGAGSWAHEINFHQERDAVDAQGFKTQGFGFAAGYDLQGLNNALGASVSVVTADVKDRGAASGERVTMNMLGAGIYWRFDGGPFQAAVRGGLSYAFMNGDRRIVSPTLDLKAKADWGAWMGDANATVSYELRVGQFYARPEATIGYLRLSEQSHTEKGASTGYELAVDHRDGDLLTGEAVLALGWRFGDDSGYWAPEIKLGYQEKLAGGPGTTTAHFSGGSDFTLDPEDAFKGGPVVRAGFRGGSKRVLWNVDGGTVFDGDYQDIDVRGTVRFQF